MSLKNVTNSTTTVIYKPFDDSATSQLVQCLYIIFGILTFIGNIIVFLVYSKIRQLRTLTNKLVISSSACGIVVSTMYVPFYLVLDGYTKSLNLRIPLSSLIASFSGFATLFNLAALTHERYIAIIHGLKYVVIMTKRRVNITLIIVWCVPALLSSTPLVLVLEIKDHFVISRCFRIYQGFLSVLLCIIISIIFTAYVHISRVRNHHVKIERNIRSKRRHSMKAITNENDSNVLKFITQEDIIQVNDQHKELERREFVTGISNDMKRKKIPLKTMHEANRKIFKLDSFDDTPDSLSVSSTHCFTQRESRKSLTSRVSFDFSSVNPKRNNTEIFSSKNSQKSYEAKTICASRIENCDIKKDHQLFDSNTRSNRFSFIDVNEEVSLNCQSVSSPFVSQTVTISSHSSMVNDMVEETDYGLMNDDNICRSDTELNNSLTLKEENKFLESKDKGQFKMRIFSKTRQLTLCLMTIKNSIKHRKSMLYKYFKEKRKLKQKNITESETTSTSSSVRSTTEFSIKPSCGSTSLFKSDQAVVIPRQNFNSNNCVYRSLLKPRMPRNSIVDQAKIFLHEIKSIKVIAVIFTINTVCWLPLIYINFVLSIGKHDLVTENLVTATKILFVINSCLMPYIYAFCKRDFKNALKKLFRNLCKRV